MHWGTGFPHDDSTQEFQMTGVGFADVKAMFWICLLNAFVPFDFL